MKIVKFSDYKIVKVDEHTTIFHRAELRKVVGLVKADSMRGVREQSETKKAASKILFNKVPSRQLVKVASKSNINQATSRRLTKTKAAKEIMNELYLIIQEIKDEIGVE